MTARYLCFGAQLWRVVVLSSVKPSLINLDHCRHSTNRAVDQGKLRLWIDFLPAIKVSSQLAQQGHALRVARVDLLQRCGPPLPHIVRENTISRNRIPYLYQSADDLVRKVS